MTDAQIETAVLDNLWLAALCLEAGEQATCDTRLEPCQLSASSCNTAYDAQ